MQPPPQTHHSRHLDAAYNLARWLIRDEGHAHEVVQQACLEANGTLATAPDEDTRRRLMAIVRSACYARLQGSDAEAHEIPAEPAIAEPPIVRGGGRRNQVNDALRRLPIELREVIVLREMEDLSYRTISAITGVPVGTVVYRLGLARARLAWNLEQDLS